MTLREKQTKFAYMLGEFLLWCAAEGHQVTLGEAWRPDFLALEYAKRKMGVMYSLHSLRLAVDLNYFVEGKYQRRSEAYRVLGEKWESMGGAWGGRFKRPDGNHFSLEHNGVK